jgi:hypothetical protein
MKTNILLDARAPHPTLLLNGAPNRAVLKAIVTGGCNCDRWGHPRPGCVQRNFQPEEMS